MTERIAIVILAALLAATALNAQQPQPATREESVVVTSGEGVVQAVPDRAWVSITAESRASSPREAQRRNADAMTPVHQKLRSAGIPADAIRTIGYDLQQEWDYANNRRVSRGYVARNTIEVRIDDINRVGEVLEIAVGAGATSVGGVRFDLRDRGKYEREALRMAVSDARMKAEAAAAGAGRAIDRVLRIEEHGVAYRPPMPYAATREVAQVGADAPAIAAGQMELRAGVALTAVLK